jgi:hypothetical protein
MRISTLFLSNHSEILTWRCQSTKRRTLMNYRICASVLVLSVVACGGGGGAAPPAGVAVAPPNSVSGAVTTPSLDVVKSAGTLQTSVTTPNYAAGSLESSAYAALDAAREAAGAGLLTQSAALDVAAAPGAITTSPYSGQTNVLETFHVSDELPRPSATLFPGATAGTPVVVNLRNADYVNFDSAGRLAVTLTTFTLRDAGRNLVPSAIFANSSLAAGAGMLLNADSNLAAGLAIRVPLAPLSKGVTYSAEFSVTLKTSGTPLAKS